MWCSLCVTRAYQLRPLSARFLLQVFTDLSAWYHDEALYKKEGQGESLPGFQMRWGGRFGGESVPDSDLLTWGNFKRGVGKWHGSLRTALKECLLSKEYMRIRNAIVVMTKLAPHFPLFELHGRDLLAVVQKLATEEKRGDLKVLGQGLLAVLKKRQPSWYAASADAGSTATAKTDAAPSQSKAGTPVPAATPTGSAALPTGPKSAGLPNIPLGPRGGRGLPQSPRQSAQAQPQQQQQPQRGPSGLGTNQSGVNGGAQQEQTSGRNTPTGPASSSRPPVSRMPSSSLPPRPVDARTQQQQRNNEQQQQQRNAEPAKREQEAPSASVVAGASAARQAVLDSMNPPKKPADTASAVAARERGGATRSGNVTPSHDRSRDEPQETTRSGRQEASRESSPPRSNRSRAASPAGSAHSAAKSQSSRRDGNDDGDRERERGSRGGDRERGERDPLTRDMYAGRRDRDRGGRDDGRRGTEQSSRSGDRDSDRRGGRGSRHERSSSGRHESSRNKDQDDAGSSTSRSRRNEGRDAEDEPSSKRRHRDERDAEAKGSRQDTPSGPSAERTARVAPEPTSSPSAGQKRSFSSRIGAVDPAAAASSNAAEAAEPVDAPDSKRVKIKGRGSETAEAAYREREKDPERTMPQGPREPTRHYGPSSSQDPVSSSGRGISIMGNARTADQSASAWGSHEPERNDDRRYGRRRGSDRDRRAQRKERRSGDA